MTKDDAWQCLDFDVAQGLTLVHGEIPHLRLGELDVLDGACTELGQAAFNLGGGQPVICAVPVVKPGR